MNPMIKAKEFVLPIAVATAWIALTTFFVAETLLFAL